MGFRRSSVRIRPPRPAPPAGGASRTAGRPPGGGTGRGHGLHHLPRTPPASAGICKDASPPRPDAVGGGAGDAPPPTVSGAQSPATPPHGPVHSAARRRAGRLPVSHRTVTSD